jgi:hypothetical protein
MYVSTREQVGALRSQRAGSSSCCGLRQRCGAAGCRHGPARYGSLSAAPSLRPPVWEPEAAATTASGESLHSFAPAGLHTPHVRGQPDGTRASSLQNDLLVEQLVSTPPAARIHRACDASQLTNSAFASAPVSESGSDWSQSACQFHGTTAKRQASRWCGRGTRPDAAATTASGESLHSLGAGAAGAAFGAGVGVMPVTQVVSHDLRSSP